MLQSSAYSLWKKVKYISICFMIIIYFIFWLQCEIHQRQFSIPLYFYLLLSNPVNKVDSILATQCKLLLESNYLKSTANGLCFQISVVLIGNKSFRLFPYHLNWKHQRCKCTMVSLKDSFIVRSFFSLYIHSMVLLHHICC